MNIKDITQLYYITDIANLLSILRKGILSFNQAEKISHKSIAEQGVQDRRQNKKIPGTNNHLEIQGHFPYFLYSIVQIDRTCSEL